MAGAPTPDRLVMVTELGSLALEAAQRGDDRAAGILRGVAEYLMVIHADLLRLERRQARDRSVAHKKLPRGSVLRDEVWRRDQGCCVLCGVAVRRFKNHRYDAENTLGHIDHITPVSQGGQNTIDNLRLLCKGCHDKKSAAERRGGA